MPRSTVLCPVDFSPASDEAVRVAAEEAIRRDTTLDLLHVWTPQPSFTADPLGVPIDVEPPLEAIGEQLAQIHPPLPENRVRRHVVVGPAVEKIVEVGEELGAAVIVMGTHARHGLARWILGSVVEPVLRTAPCPVLICRGPHREPSPQSDAPRAEGGGTS